MSDLHVTFPKPCSENWEDMKPQGCNRFCTSCTKTIIDLAQITLDQAEVLLRSSEEICVRASIAKDGSVRLREDSGSKARRMVATLGASMGLLSMSGVALANTHSAEGVIAGVASGHGCGFGDVIAHAVGPDGEKHSVKVKDKGQYKIKHLSPGTYQLEFSESGTPTWTGDKVQVKDLETVIAKPSSPNDGDTCIIVGRLEVQDNNG